MSKKPAKKPRRFKKKISKIKAEVLPSKEMDSSFILRIFREELDEESISVAVLSRTYPKEELSIARRVARILTKAEAGPDNEGPDTDLTAAEELLLAKARSLYGRKPTSKEQLKKAGKILKDLGIRKASVLAEGKMLHITAGRTEIVKLAKSLAKIRKKMKALGFYDVLLSLSS